MPQHLRIAMPVSNLASTTDMYCRGLNLRVLGKFEDHDGFDGVMLGAPGDEGTYPDDDLKAVSVEGKWQFTRKDGTPY